MCHRPVRAFIKGPTFADCRRHFLQKKIRQHPTCKQKPINRGTLSFQSCQNPPVFSLLLILCVLIPRAGSPLLADRLANPRQRSASGNLQGDHVPQKKKRKIPKRSQNLRAQAVKKPNRLFRIFFFVRRACGEPVRTKFVVRLRRNALRQRAVCARCANLPKLRPRFFVRGTSGRIRRRRRRRQVPTGSVSLLTNVAPKKEERFVFLN